MMRNKALLLAIAIPAALLLAALIYNLPPVQARLGWRVDELRARIKYAFDPPEEAVFAPQQQAALQVLPSVTPTTRPSVTPLPPGPTVTPPPSPTATITPTPLPGKAALEGVKYEDQHNRWNYCGPANLSMALTFWGWEGNRDVVGRAIKPSDKDKNVMPYEMQQFVEAEAPGLAALVRLGGDLDLLKRLIAAGFPVVAEKGYYEYDYTGKLGWMGHYQFVTGYDDTAGMLTVQDTYVKDGKDHQFAYEDFLAGWRSFNYTYVVVYPQERADEVYALLGSSADANAAARRALETARAESETLLGIDQFFAWFNIGSSHVNLLEYADAAAAFDQAFGLYAALEEGEAMRPYRMMWYQTWPYRAYYYTGRYQDVLNLADTTLIETISEPVLEESFYWRALAKEALGDVSGAIDDLRAAVQINPNFGPGWEQLNRLGGG